MSEITKRELTKGDLTTEEYREYEYTPVGQEGRTTYRIESPVAVFFYKGCSTHRVLDANGVVHIVPAIGQLGCAVRYKAKAGFDPVSW